MTETTSPYAPNPQRYTSMAYARCGTSGLRLPRISLGQWQNFGDQVPFDDRRRVLLAAFDRGITHIDLANNYGPPPGAAERNVGRVLGTDLAGHRDEVIVSTKAGYDMWDGPYGIGGSRKHLLASLDQSLARLGLDYVDIFYSHRVDPEVPLVETMGALKTAVDSGRALYVGVSSYSATRTLAAIEAAREVGVPLLIHQPSYSILNRWIETPSPKAEGRSLLDVVDDAGLGLIAFSPLGQGLLTGKYTSEVPAGSRAAKGYSFKPEHLAARNLQSVAALAEIASARGQSLAQMAIAWVLRDPRVTSALIGASSVRQLDENLAALGNTDFAAIELAAIDTHSFDAGLNIWSRSTAIE
ncbi:MAG: L-glyceraldehyde 3-phosphate reductase [Bifidobacteriaceae bacterium]|jgi:L-glyceraldehyde 3-phosphate reductase|nr:L-glyceraldehyde 3-phosphate reductase [Bifidobacteriaceae bacterium]